MSYIADSLGRNEALIYRAHFPWFYSAGAMAVLLAAVVAGVAAYASGYGGLALVFLLAGLVLFLVIMVPVWTTEIGVTSQRLVEKRGWLWRKTQELQLRAIEEVNLDQGLLGRLFNFGKLELHGTGVDDIKLPTLADPLGIRKALQDGMAAGQQAVLAAPAPAPAREARVS